MVALANGSVCSQTTISEGVKVHKPGEKSAIFHVNVSVAEGHTLWSYSYCDFDHLTNSKAYPNKTTSPSCHKITK